MYNKLQKFGEKLRRMRTKKKWSQGELSRRSGLHRTYISGIEKGIRNPSLKNIERLASALGVSPSQFFT